MPDCVPIADHYLPDSYRTKGAGEAPKAEAEIEHGVLYRTRQLDQGEARVHAEDMLDSPRKIGLRIADAAGSQAAQPGFAGAALSARKTTGDNERLASF